MDPEVALLPPDIQKKEIDDRKPTNTSVLKGGDQIHRSATDPEATWSNTRRLPRVDPKKRRYCLWQRKKRGHGWSQAVHTVRTKIEDQRLPSAKASAKICINIQQMHGICISSSFPAFSIAQRVGLPTKHGTWREAKGNYLMWTNKDHQHKRTKKKSGRDQNPCEAAKGSIVIFKRLVLCDFLLFRVAFLSVQ